MYISSTSATVAVSGRFTVLLIAPDRNGCAAAIILMCPMAAMERSPIAQSNTLMCSGRRAGAPSTVACSSM